MYKAVMKFACTVMALSMSVAAMSQDMKSIALGPPQFVAKGVDSVHWAPNGRALLYVCDIDGQKEIGTFELTKDDGQRVLSLTKEDRIDSLNWLAGQKKAVLVVVRVTERPSVRILVVDTLSKTSKELWAHHYEPADLPGVTVDTSPVLDHALVTISSPKAEECWVLTNGANGVVFSRDVATARSQGSTFVGWTPTGTAVFATAIVGRGTVMSGPILGDIPVKVTVPGNQADPQIAGEKYVVRLSLDSSEVSSRTLSNGSLNLIFRMTPVVQPGDTVLECVPANGALRSVRFPGYFAAKPVSDVYLVAHRQLHELKLGKTQASSNALWLVPMVPQTATTEGTTGLAEPLTAVPKEGVLVSAQADGWWPSPQMQSVAFVWNGVLFVRSVGTIKK